MYMLFLGLGALCVGTAFWWFVYWQLPMGRMIQEVESKLPSAERSTSPYRRERIVMLAVFAAGVVLTSIGSFLRWYS